MLLGCCHCGEEPPSESIPPSESESQSESQSQSLSDSASDESSNPYLGCSICIGGVAPAVMKATIGYTGTGVGLCCAAYNQPNYLLYPIVGCDYGSAEKPLNQFLSPASCIEQLDPLDPSRVRLTYTATLMRVDYVYYAAGTPIRIRWEKTFVAGTMNCLINHTLDYVRLDFFNPALPRKWAGPPVCATTQSVPASITVGPA
jgi:hypothetical protein